jgi:hypothetical protein
VLVNLSGCYIPETAEWYSGEHTAIIFKKVPTISSDNKNKKVKVKISLLQAVETHRVTRGRGSHIS